MPIDASWTSLRGEVLRLLVPSEAEKGALGELRGRLERELTRRLEEAGLRAVAEVHGSAARGTWISGDRDIDLFIVLDGGYGRDVLPGVLDVVKAYVGEGWVEAYAELRFPDLPLRVASLDEGAPPQAAEGQITVGISHR